MAGEAREASFPVTGWLMVMLGVLVAPGVKIPARPPARRVQDDSLIRFGRLLTISITAGLGLVESWELAADRAGGSCGSEATAVLRRARSSGLSAELRTVPGDLGVLASGIAHAQALGAPLVPAVTAALDHIRSRRRARRIEAIRTLSVRMTVPLTLLLLPGFVAVVIVPYLFDGLAAFPP